MTLLENLETDWNELGLVKGELLEHIKELYRTNKIKLADMYEITNAFRIEVKDD